MQILLIVPQKIESTNTAMAFISRFKSRLIARSFLAAALVVLSSCGSSETDESASADAADVADPGAESSTEDTLEESAEAGATGNDTGTVTTSDGTTYEFVMSSCDTSENGRGTFLIEDAYSISGKTADGAFAVDFIRAGATDETVGVATLEGDFDDEGKNAKMLYSSSSSPLQLTVDGSDVTGTVTVGAIGPTQPHGDTTELTVNITC